MTNIKGNVHEGSIPCFIGRGYPLDDALILSCRFRDRLQQYGRLLCQERFDYYINDNAYDHQP